MITPSHLNCGCETSFSRREFIKTSAMEMTATPLIPYKA